MTRVCSAILGLILAAPAAQAQTVFVPPVRIEIPAGQAVGLGATSTTRCFCSGWSLCEL